MAGSASPTISAPPSASPAVGSSSIDSSGSRRARTSPGSRSSASTSQPVPPERSVAASSGRGCATRTSRRRMPRSPGTASVRSTAVAIGRDVVATVHHLPLAPGATLAPRPGQHDPRRPRRLLGPVRRADPRPLPRRRRVQHGAVVERGHDGRGGAQHPRRTSTLSDRDPGGADPPRARVHAPRVRRPKPVHRRSPVRQRPRASSCSPAPSAASGRASSTRRTRSRVRSRPATRSPGPADAPSRAPPASRPRGMRPTRTTSSSPTATATSSPTRTRSSSSAGAGSSFPGRGFLLNNELTDFDFAPATRGCPGPESPGRRQTSALEHVADDRAPQRTAVPRHRRGRRRDDHHDGARHPRQPDRSRHDAPGGDRRPAGLPAQQRHDPGRAGVHRPADDPGARGPRAVVHRLKDTSPLDPTITIPSTIGTATGLEFLDAPPDPRGGRAGPAAEAEPAAVLRRRAEAPGFRRTAEAPRRLSRRCRSSPASPAADPFSLN